MEKGILIKAKEAIVKGWNYFEGKKTTIYAIVQSGLIIAHWISPTMISGDTYAEAQKIITVFGIFALGDKARRNEQLKKWMENLSGKLK